MKDNKHGWGFIELILFLIIFVICLILALLGLKKLGLVNEDWRFVNPNDKSNEKVVSYKELEERMINGAKDYIKTYYNNQLGLDTLNIKVSQLIKNGNLNDLKRKENEECSGYVSVYLDANNNIVYDPYLKCDDYETDGYQSRKDD